MRKKTKVILALCMVMAILFLAACGNADNNSGDTSSAATTAGTGSETGSGTGINKTVITFQTWNPDEPAFQSVEKDFETKFPQYDVQLTFIPYSDHISKLKVDLASGEGPDTFGLQTGATMKEFNEFLVDLAPQSKAEWGDNWLEKFIPFTTELIKGSLDSYYGLPLGSTYAGMLWADTFYFDKYGYEIPGNLPELKEITQKFRQNGEYPLAIGAKDDWINIDMFMNIANDINPDKLYSAIEGKIPWTDADLVEALTIWGDLFTSGVFQDGALGVNMYNDTTDLYDREGSIPMICNGSWDINSYLKTDEQIAALWEDAKSGHGHVPFALDWNNDGKPAPVTAAVDVVIVQNKQSENPEAAWDFVSYMVTDGADILINDLLFYFPAKAGVEFEGQLTEAGMDAFNKVSEIASNVAGYREIAYPQLKQTICDNLKAIATGSVIPQQAAEAIEAVSKTTER